VDAIVAHPLVTALGLGPYDLSADIGCCWTPDAPAFQSVLNITKSAADPVGKKVWAGTNTTQLLAKGYTFLWVGTVSSVLGQSLAQTVKSLKTGPPPGRERELPSPRLIFVQFVAV